MQEITLHWKHSPILIKKDEVGLAFKRRVGHNPNTLCSKIVLKGLRRNINRHWKRELTEKIQNVRFFADTPCVVFAGRFKLELHGTKSAAMLANNIANVLLRKRHQDRDAFGRSRESLLESVK